MQRLRRLHPRMPCGRRYINPTIERGGFLTLTVVITEPPYVNDSSWNALRLAQAAVASGHKVNIFLLGDAVYTARRDQRPDPGRPNLEEMTRDLITSGADVRTCTTCVKARTYEPTGDYQSCFIGSQSGEKLGQQHLIKGVRMGTMADLLEWTLNTKTISF